MQSKALGTQSSGTLPSQASPTLAATPPANLHAGSLSLPHVVTSPERRPTNETVPLASSVPFSCTGSVSAVTATPASPPPAVLSGSSLGYLLMRVSTQLGQREQALQKHLEERRDIDDILARSKDELQQLVGVVAQLHELQQSASGPNGLADASLRPGPEKPSVRGRPPFFWQPSSEYAKEFVVSGEHSDVVTKVNDFEDQGWVIPVGGAWRLSKGGVYRWTVKIERKCPSRPQLQLGIHGWNHSQPWRLVTTSRCSWSRDDEPWQDRAGGDRLIDEGDYVHVQVDLRGLSSKMGTLSLAINDEPYEQFFDDIPLNMAYPLMPVVSMGGDQSCVRVSSSY